MRLGLGLLNTSLPLKMTLGRRRVRSKLLRWNLTKKGILRFGQQGGITGVSSIRVMAMYVPREYSEGIEARDITYRVEMKDFSVRGAV